MLDPCARGRARRAEAWDLLFVHYGRSEALYIDSRPTPDMYIKIVHWFPFVLVDLNFLLLGMPNIDTR